MNRDTFSAWVNTLVRAWENHDAQAVEQLFTDNATYQENPFDEALRGRAAIPAGGDKLKGIVMHSLFGIGSATRPSARRGVISVWLGTALLAATATHAVAAPPLDADTMAAEFLTIAGALR